ncbi:MAG: UDP-N-acetylglucosamine 4,6-dehydratase (inverting) [Proteobacteria bacterium]|nr:UDP-N-acetylglucosamine 4,6-dehydratase (inverting) [Pseudomonadota bacterium]
MADLFTDDMPDLEGKSILITGGTGSFGKAFLRRVMADFAPRRVAVYSRGEHEHFKMLNALTGEDAKVFRSFIGDVRDRDRLEMAMRGVDLVIHAAALKQVPIAEYNPFECINTNVIGAENVVQAAIRAEVKTVIALSTDKAVNPINLYGASKLAADKIFVAANNLGIGSGTKFSVVRYGNVIGSQGSVVPFFRKLIEDGASELPITDDRMTRFWITLDQAVNFVLSAISMMRGGEIFVPKIPSLKVTDLATAMAPDLGQKIIGVRPGEKLHEMMVDQYSSRVTVDLGDRYAIEPEWQFWKRTSFREDGKPGVAEDFEYRSDNNEWWLSSSELEAMLAETEQK